MTNEEAMKSALVKVMAQQEFGFSIRFDVQELLAVIEALEARIPKPHNTGYERAWGVSKKAKVCPACDYFIYDVFFIDADDKKRPHIAYCGHCGQAIDYDEEATENG